MSRRLERANIPHQRADPLLGWAAWNLDAAQLGWDVFQQSRPQGDHNLTGHPLYEVEFAAMNLVFRGVVSEPPRVPQRPHTQGTFPNTGPSRRGVAPLGYEELYVQEDCVSYGAEDLDDFTICRGEPVTTAAHVAFSAEGRDAVDAFFAAAVANGATVRGEPGVWTQYSERYYAAFVNDLHQNNVEAVWHAPEPVVDAPRRPGVP